MTAAFNPYSDVRTTNHVEILTALNIDNGINFIRRFF